MKQHIFGDGGYKTCTSLKLQIPKFLSFQFSNQIKKIRAMIAQKLSAQFLKQNLNLATLKIDCTKIERSYLKENLTLAMIAQKLSAHF